MARSSVRHSWSVKSRLAASQVRVEQQGRGGQGEKPRGIAHRVSGQPKMFGQVLQAFEPKDGETAFCPCWGEGAEPSFPAQEKEPAGAGVMMSLQRPENVILIDIDEAGQL
ncbi:hypothetical protein G6L99_31500 [Agrobacterium rhizogenes]|nr:hypothetical protein [Rhizobium rhizogenes]